ncbi:MAG TPA: hypothetical protein VFV09_08095 [Actinomycetota bacterium]|nr:hypothetical protein [Actinomycetota bacterium]
MAGSMWEKLCSAAVHLNRGDPGPALDLCPEQVELTVGQTAGSPSPSRYAGRDTITGLWQETFESLNGAIEVRPAKLLAGDGHMVLFIDLFLGSGSQREEKKLILTGAAGSGGLWDELWLQFDDLPVRLPAGARSEPGG